MDLRLLQNRIDGQAQKYLFPAITISSSLGSLSGLEGGTLGIFYEYVVGETVIYGFVSICISVSFARLYLPARIQSGPFVTDDIRLPFSRASVLLALTPTLTHVNSFTAKVAAVQKHVPMPSPEFVKALDLSKAQLQIFPVVLLELKALETLDISFNELQQLPYIELCALSRLVRLDCQGERSCWIHQFATSMKAPALLAHADAQRRKIDRCGNNQA